MGKCTIAVAVAAAFNGDTSSVTSFFVDRYRVINRSLLIYGQVPIGNGNVSQSTCSIGISVRSMIIAHQRH